ncbi:LexA family protein [Pseudomonas sp. xss_4]|uniref:LexA family protein n=1 Tax=Pseudomonas sp. xss_4 TaxID=3367216 RepID=UPI00370A580F
MFTVLGPVLYLPERLKKPVLGRVSCGFPSPALEYAEPPLSLDELVGLREPSRWLVRADGQSLRDLGIYNRDVLIVDRALEPLDLDVVICVMGGDFTAKQYLERPGLPPVLKAHNPMCADVLVGEWEDVECWGVVLWNLHRVSRR